MKDTDWGILIVALVAAAFAVVAMVLINEERNK